MNLAIASRVGDYRQAGGYACGEMPQVLRFRGGTFTDGNSALVTQIAKRSIRDRRAVR
jgi:hypothetical protein